mgnify:CR=1 FL=1
MEGWSVMARLKAVQRGEVGMRGGVLRAHGRPGCVAECCARMASRDAWRTLRRYPTSDTSVCSSPALKASAASEGTAAGGTATVGVSATVCASCGL